MNRDLGNSFTFINNELVKIKMIGRDVPPDSNNIFHKIQYAYILTNEHKNIDLVVKITKENLREYLKDEKNKLFHSIRFGLNKIKEDLKNKVVTFTTEEYENLIDSFSLSGDSLRLVVLKFIYRVNAIIPGQWIDTEDMIFNIPGDEDDIKNWAAELARQGYFQEKSISRFHRYNEGSIALLTYKINSKYRKEIIEELDNNKSLSAVDTIKVFMSYHHKDKLFAGEIKQHLENANLDVFVAHDDIEISEKWQDRILKELKECHVFMALITPNFRPSEWTNQEAGHAIAGNKVIIPLFKDEIHGFLNRYQGLKIDNKTPAKLAEEILRVISDKKEFADKINI